MGIKNKIKKAIMTKQIDKRKAGSTFDIVASDTFEIPEGADASYNHSHYFSMHKLGSKESMFLRYARRGGDGKTEIWFTFRDKDGNVYYAEKDHYLKSEKCPVTLEIVEPGKLLKFTYKGDATLAEFNNGDAKATPKSKKVKVEMKGEFEGTSKLFEFSHHLPTEPLAHAFAKEKWTKAFIEALKENHQAHCEQQGLISCTIKIDGKIHEFNKVSSLRDHSYGKRDWGYFDRHIWILGLMENGDMFHTSFTRYPAVAQLSSGFYLRDGEPLAYVKRLQPMDTLPIVGKCPEELSYIVELDDGRTITVNTTREFEVQFDFQGNYTISEGVSTFEVDGIKGRGITEFGFNPDKSKWTRGAK